MKNKNKTGVPGYDSNLTSQQNTARVISVTRDLAGSSAGTEELGNYVSYPIHEPGRKRSQDSHMLKKNLRPFGSVQKTKNGHIEAFGTPAHRPAKLPLLTPSEKDKLGKISKGNLSRETSEH